MKRVILLLYIIFLLSLCGCTGYREIERGYLVTALGISNAEYKTTVYLEAMASTDTTDKESQKCILSSSGNTLSEAFEALESQLIKPLHFEQLGTVIFDNNLLPSDVAFLNNLPCINYGLYIVKTDNTQALFEGDFSNSILGYDIIGLIKTNFTKNKINITNQLYQFDPNESVFPVVNNNGHSLIISIAGE